MQWKNIPFLGGHVRLSLSDHLAHLQWLSLWLWHHKSARWAWRKREEEEAEQDCSLHWQPAIALAKAERQIAN